jgi:signal transduction histidine kinase
MTDKLARPILVAAIGLALIACGSAPEPLVFERFWRADPARSRSGNGGKDRQASGSGLGLAVAQSLVEAQGGQIWVESTPGQGAIFRFSLPLAG